MGAFGSGELLPLCKGEAVCRSKSGCAASEAVEVPKVGPSQQFTAHMMVFAAELSFLPLHASDPCNSKRQRSSLAWGGQCVVVIVRRDDLVLWTYSD